MSVRKLRLTSHFRDSTYEDKSVVKNGSTFTPKNNEIKNQKIKPADKGFVVVVMSSEYYQTMCQSHLNNEQYYLSVD